MGSERTTRRLGDYLQGVIDNRGKTPPNDTARTKYELLEVNCLTGSGRRPNYEVVRKFVTKETYDSWFRNGHPKKNDVIISTVGSIGEVCISEGRGSIAQNLIALSPKSDVLAGEFLYYYLSSQEVKNALLALNISSVQPSIKVPHLLDLEISVPPLPEQKRIAHILGTLDDKIELNRRINATLEAMARELFQSWFIDFDPVRAKLDGRQPTALDPATAALFPDLFQDSELGHIPKGWRVTSVGEACQSIFSGGTPSTQNATYWGGYIPWLSSGETRSPFIIDTEKTITKDGVENSSTRIARAGCTVIAGAGQGHTRGQTSLLTFESYINQSVVALVANPKVSSDLFLFFDLARRYDEFRQLSDSHSSRGSLTTKLLASVRCVLPPHDLVVAFDHAVRPFAEQITANLHQSRTLSTLRDTLLSKLLSGELSTKN